MPRSAKNFGHGKFTARRKKKRCKCDILYTHKKVKNLKAKYIHKKSGILKNRNVKLYAEWVQNWSKKISEMENNQNVPIFRIHSRTT